MWSQATARSAHRTVTGTLVEWFVIQCRAHQLTATVPSIPDAAAMRQSGLNRIRS
jgi:hypothetical protein